jgi:hypothetical protein
VNTKTAIGFVVLVVVVLVGGLAYLIHQLQNVGRAQIEATREAFMRTVTRADSMASARKDSLVIIERNVLHVAKETSRRLSAVQNTHNVDSLVRLYYHFRTSPSSRFRDGGR